MPGIWLIYMYALMFQLSKHRTTYRCNRDNRLQFLVQRGMHSHLWLRLCVNTNSKHHHYELVHSSCWFPDLSIALDCCVYSHLQWTQNSILYPMLFHVAGMTCFAINFKLFFCVCVRGFFVVVVVWVFLFVLFCFYTAAIVVWPGPQYSYPEVT